MKKLMLLLGLCLVVLGALPLTASAVAVEELTVLSAYFPADTVMFAALRSDDGYLETLNSVIARLQQRVDQPVQTIQDALDETIGGIGDDATFAEDVRPWLGSTIAIGARNLDSRFGPTVVLALAVTDREAAAAFIASRPNVTASEEDGYTEFTTGAEQAFRLYDQALLFAERAVMLDEISEGDRLNSSEDFTATLTLLPEPDYNIVLYVQSSALFDLLRVQAAVEGADAMTEAMLAQMGSVGSVAVGLAVLDGRHFTIDAASRASADTDAAMLPATDAPAVDLSVAGRVPAGAPLVIFATDLGRNIRHAIDMLGMALEMGIDQEIAMNTGQDMPPFIANLDVNDVRAFINLAFAGFTGLNLENDVLANLNGTTAFFAGWLPDEALDIIPDLGMVTQMDDAASANILTSLQDALTQYEADFSVEGSVLTLPWPLREALRQDFPDADLSNPALDMLIGYNGGFFALGTRPAVEFSLNPGGASLADDAAFVEAQTYFLPDSESIAYIHLTPIVEFIDDEMNPRASQSGNDALKVLSLFTSGSISGRVDDDGTSYQRLVLTLSAE
ncbi:MAG: DUF3352 domain-containing protein [Chloroflexi bacterium]|nr:DUF3352 domain-containing protein [Chloroflexota bacterium]